MLRYCLTNDAKDTLLRAWASLVPMVSIATASVLGTVVLTGMLTLAIADYSLPLYVLVAGTLGWGALIAIPLAMSPRVIKNSFEKC